MTTKLEGTNLIVALSQDGREGLQTTIDIGPTGARYMDKGMALLVSYWGPTGSWMDGASPVCAQVPDDARTADTCPATVAMITNFAVSKAWEPVVVANNSEANSFNASCLSPAGTCPDVGSADCSWTDHGRKCVSQVDHGTEDFCRCCCRFRPDRPCRWRFWATEYTAWDWVYLSGLAVANIFQVLQTLALLPFFYRRASRNLDPRPAIERRSPLWSRHTCRMRKASLRRR